MGHKTRAMLICLGMSSGSVLGCDDPLELSDVAGIYTLQTVEGQPPPYLIQATTECDVTVVSGTLTLESTGTHDILIDTPADCTRGGGGVTMFGRTYPGRFQLTGGSTITFRSPTQSGPDMVYTGSIQGDRITITVPDLGSGLTPDLTVGFGR
jgi:hypothetical protein